MDLNWKSLHALLPNCILVSKALLAIIVVDIAISVSASFIIDDDWYFERFLSFSKYEKNKKSRYHQIVNKFFSGEFPLAYDKESGWVNQAGYKDGQWVTCSLGSRVPVEMRGKDIISQANQNDDLIFLLGSSVVGGHGTGHGYEDTPGYYLNGRGYKTLDFGTAVYSIDQSFTYYKNNLAEYKPKVLVVGIHHSVEAISNMFIPLVNHDLSIPLMKPAYDLSGDQLIKHLPPVEAQHAGDNIGKVSALEKGDSQYYKYMLYKRLSLLPISDFLRNVILRVDANFYYDVDEYQDAVALQQHFMKEFVALADERGAEVIFVKFETLYDMEVSPLKQLFNRYAYKNKNKRHTELLKQTPFNILYTSDIFADTGKPASHFFIEGDGLHLTSHANDLLAKKLVEEVERLKSVKRLH